MKRRDKQKDKIIKIDSKNTKQSVNTKRYGMKGFLILKGNQFFQPSPENYLKIRKIIIRNDPFGYRAIKLL